MVVPWSCSTACRKGLVHGIKADLDGQIPCHRVAGDGGKGPWHGGGLVSMQGWKAALGLQVAGCVPGRHRPGKARLWPCT